MDGPKGQGSGSLNWEPTRSNIQGGGGMREGGGGLGGGGCVGRGGGGGGIVRLGYFLLVPLLDLGLTFRSHEALGVFPGYQAPSRLPFSQRVTLPSSRFP